MSSTAPRSPGSRSPPSTICRPSDQPPGRLHPPDRLGGILYRRRPAPAALLGSDPPRTGRRPPPRRPTQSPPVPPRPLGKRVFCRSRKLFERNETRLVTDRKDRFSPTGGIDPTAGPNPNSCRHFLQGRPDSLTDRSSVNFNASKLLVRLLLPAKTDLQDLSGGVFKFLSVGRQKLRQARPQYTSGVYSTSISTDFGLAFSDLGSWSWSIPSLKEALIFSSSILSGRMKLREKQP